MAGGSGARHETLRAAVDWSYELLDDDEKKVLDRCAVFAGSWSLEAAEAVDDPGDLKDQQVVDLLTRLVDKSLVGVGHGETATRYRLLETIRQYALERLEAGGETAETRDRHLDYFVDFATRAGPGLVSPEERDWIQRTEAEIENCALPARGRWSQQTLIERSGSRRRSSPRCTSTPPGD